jgi:hypothetical protein
VDLVVSGALPQCVDARSPLLNNGGTLTTLPVTARKFTASYVSTDDTALAVMQGVSGDRVCDAQPSFAFTVAPALADTGSSHSDLANIVPSSSGVLNTNVRRRSAGSAAVLRINFQGYVVTALAVLGSPFHVASLNQNFGPDCNGNGRATSSTRSRALQTATRTWSTTPATRGE